MEAAEDGQSMHDADIWFPALHVDVALCLLGKY